MTAAPRRGALIAWLTLALATQAGAALRSSTNGYLSVEVEDAGPGAGMFSIRTGALHPSPLQSVLYQVGTSYVTLRDNTAQEVWANAGTIVNTEIVPYAFRSMQSLPATSSVETLADGLRVRYTLPNWTVVQEIVVRGSTLRDTHVVHAITVTNVSSVPRSYGVRSLLDWDLGGVSVLALRRLEPDAAPTTTFFATDAPAFRAVGHSDPRGDATFDAYGTVAGGPLAATPPDRFGFVSWLDLFEAPWDTTITGEDDDGATVHYWGHAVPLVLVPGASATFTQHVATSLAALGLGNDEPAVDVPGLSRPAAIALSILLTVAALRARRQDDGTGRRRTATVRARKSSPAK